MMIVSDIGGTYARFAQVENTKKAELVRLAKYTASDFVNLGAALDRYCEEGGIHHKGTLCIATAGYCDEDGIWKITNNDDWVIDTAHLKEQGWEIPLVMNDFEACTWSLPVLKEDDLKILKTSSASNGPSNNGSMCVLGPGTGLGLAYYHKTLSMPFVQKTHGGHMPLSVISTDQWAVKDAYRAQKHMPVVFEDFVSGPGLKRLQSLCGNEKTALRLFHEFLGLFAAQSIIHGHAYGGLYLTGGVIQNLIAEGDFDFETFEQWMCIEGVPCVQDDLRKTPIFYITEPNPALKGLINAQSLSDN